VSKSDVGASDTLDTPIKGTKDGKKKEKEDRTRKHDDTDYDSEGLDDI